MDPQFSALIRGAITGHYPPGTTARMLADAPDLIDPRAPRAGFATTLLHIAAECGHLPADITAELLVGETDDLDRTALELAIETGHLPANIDARTLAEIRMCSGDTGLHRCAIFGAYPTGTTEQDLISATDEEGWTALHAAAREVNLLAKTTIKTLTGPAATLKPKAPPPHLETPLDALLFTLQEELTSPPSLIYATKLRGVLFESTKLAELNVESVAQLKQVGAVLSKYCPVETALWIAGEMRKFQQNFASCHQFRNRQVVD